MHFPVLQDHRQSLDERRLARVIGSFYHYLHGLSLVDQEAPIILSSLASINGENPTCISLPPYGKRRKASISFCLRKARAENGRITFSGGGSSNRYLASLRNTQAATST